MISPDESDEELVGAAKLRRVGDDGEVRCGDLLGYGRRLCGPCSRPETINAEGCGDLIERIRTASEVP